MKGKREEGKDSSTAGDQRTIEGCLQQRIKKLRRGCAIFGVDMRWVTSKTGPVQISWCWRGVANYKCHQTQKFFRRH